jgi:hypothetical protein
MYILIALWFFGFVLAFIMQRTEIRAEKLPYTFGNRLLITTLSLLSFLWILVILVSAWIDNISKTGFFKEEINPTIIEKTETT